MKQSAAKTTALNRIFGLKENTGSVSSVSYATEMGVAKKKMLLKRPLQGPSAILAAEGAVSYYKAGPQISPRQKPMPQLDFREALSTPEEKLYSAPVQAASPRVSQSNSFLRDLGLSHSTWANIVFVTIATAGAIGTAFYFFNGAEVLRAAASWPGEFLYPRPAMTGAINVAVQPISVDRYDRDSNSAATKNGAEQDAISPDFQNVQLAQETPLIESQGSIPITSPSDGTILPSAPAVIPVTPITPILSVPPLQPVVAPPTDSIFHDLNSASPGTGNFVESTLQTLTGTVTGVIPKDAPAATASTKIAATKKKVVNSRSKIAARGAVNSASKSSSQSTQKIATQMQSPIIQNQTMFGGGMGATAGLSGGGGVGVTGVSGGGTGGTGGVGGIGTAGGIGGVGGVGGVGGIGGLPGVGGIGDCPVLAE